MVFETEAVGNLTRDPEMRKTQSGEPYCMFTIAINIRNNDTFFLRVKAWKGLADTCYKYLLKGRKVFVKGDLEKPYAFTNNEGQPACIICINANKVEFLTGIQKTESHGSEVEDPREPPKENEEKKEFVPVEVPEDELPF